MVKTAKYLKIQSFWYVFLAEKHKKLEKIIKVQNYANFLNFQSNFAIQTLKHFYHTQNHMTFVQFPNVRYLEGQISVTN